MIRSKEEYYFFLKEDLKRNLGVDKLNIFKFWFYLFIKSNGAIAYNYLKSLRKLEYLLNCKRGILGRIQYKIALIYHRRLAYKYDVDIRPNTVGYGLYLPHIIGGGIICNCKSIGNYCAINTGVLLGNKNTKDEIPVVGNNVDLTTGTKIIGNISIGDNVIVAPNSVVVHDIPSNVVVSGIPAKIIKYR